MYTHEIDFAGELLILTGPPGSGKTTTSIKLAQLPGSRKVHLHTDDFWHFIKAGKIEPYLPEANEQNGIVMNVIAQAASEYAKGGYFVIIDGIIGPWFLHPFSKFDIAVHYIILSPSLEQALNRCQARGGETLVEPGPIISLHQQFSSLDSHQQHVMPITNFGKNESFNAVISGLQSREFLLKPYNKY